MINYLRQLHDQLFFNLHALVGYSELTDSIIYFFAQTLDVYLIVIAMLTLLVVQYHRATPHEERMNLVKEMFLITFAVLASWFVAHFLKLTIGGLRPFEFYEALEPLFFYAGGDTFPSGHATFFSALALMMTAFHRRIGMVFIVLAVLISLSRVIAGVHYPLDILAGWIIGGTVSYLVYYGFKKQPLL